MSATALIDTGADLSQVRSLLDGLEMAPVGTALVFTPTDYLRVSRNPNDANVAATINPLAAPAIGYTTSPGSQLAPRWGR